MRFGDAFDPVEYMRVQSEFMVRNVEDIEEILEEHKEAKKAKRQASKLRTAIA